MSEDKVEQAAPKWGTKEWIAAYPWSKMDRRRKRRVLAALPEGFANLLGQDQGYLTYLRNLVTQTSYTKKSADKVSRLMTAIDRQAVQVVDLTVAAALECVWCADAGKPAAEGDR